MADFLRNVDPVFYYLGLTGLAKYALYYRWKDQRASNAKLAGHVTELWLYPVKSAKGIGLKEIECAPRKGAFSGNITDRHWMVITKEHDMISSRQEPIISKIGTEFEGNTLILSAPGCKDISIDIASVEKSGKEVSTHVHGVPTKGLDCGDEVSAWISNIISKPGHRLVYCAPNIYRRGVIGGHNKYLDWTKVAKEDDKLAFHDSISFHLLSEESMGDLNSRLPSPMDIHRFRANILVSTGASPYDEDTWHDVSIGDARFRGIKLCARCVLPTVDPETGTKDKNEEPLKTLQSYRSFLPSPLGPALGLDLIVEKPGTIKVGDPIYIVRGDNVSKP